MASMQTIQYAVVYEESRELYFLEDSPSSKFVSWLPVNNLYATPDIAWWDLYNAIEHGMKSGMQFVEDRAKDIEVIYDHSDPSFFIGNYKIVPVTLKVEYEFNVGAFDHVTELHD
jgi:hypothetical protein